MRLACLAVLFVLATACGAPETAGTAKPQDRPASTALPADTQAVLQSQGIDPARLRCNGRQQWNPALRAEAKATAAKILSDLAELGMVAPAGQQDEARRRVTDAVLWRMVLTGLVDGELHNLGAVVLPTVPRADGQPVVLFRSSFTPRPGTPGSCVSSLVEAGGVRHIVSLYAGPMPTEALAAGEAGAVRAAGGTYFDARTAPAELAEWREDLRAGDDPTTARQAAMRAVARLIREQILRPGGKAPLGNVQVHCGGGMHRTGMVVGVLERCLAGADPQTVEQNYKRHVGWRSDQEPGGFEEENLAFIREFDCQLLSPTFPSGS